MRRQEAERIEVNANGMVEITTDQYREYQDLLNGRDKSLDAVRTQARLQNAEAMRLAHEFVKAIDSVFTIQGLEHIAGNVVQTAYEHANDFLTSE